MIHLADHAPRASAVLIVLTAVFLLASCAAGDGEGAGFPGEDRADLIASSDASFRVRFPAAYSGGEDVACSGIRSGNTVTLTAEQPGRIAGTVFTLTMADTPFSVSVSGPDFPAVMPVDPAAARALTDVFSLLYDPESRREGGAVPGPEPDGWEEEAAALFVPAVRRIGEETAFRYDTGTLILGPDGLPARAECPDLSGAFRTVFFEDYTLPGR